MLPNVICSENHYNYIKNLVISKSCTNSALNNLKELFNQDISSPRTFDRILNLKDLIHVLEKRDSLSVDNTEALILIAKKLEINYSLFEEQRSVNFPLFSTSTQTDDKQPPLIEIYDSEVKQKVYDKIANELGRNWLEFARKLKLRQHYLDELKERHPYIKDRVYAILRTHENNCQKKFWRSDIMNALEKSRRSDLRDEVDYIFNISKI